MAATNPFRVSDLIAKYGWKIMPYLSNLGPQLLAEAQVLFVDSGHTNALDADDTEHGHSFEKPLATIDYAIGLCTAGEGSIIFVAPGHNDPLGNAQIDFNISDITIIGIGEGTNKPTVNYDHANSSVDIGANNIHLINLRFLPAITDVLVGVDIETGVTGTIIENCVWDEGENAADEFVLSVDIKAGCNNTKITNCKFRTKVAAAGCTNGIQLNDASDNVIIEKCRLLGNYSNAAINGITGASTDVLIDDVTIKTADSATGIKMYTGTTGIIRNACLEVTGTAVNSMIVADAMAWFNNYGVTSDGTAAEIVGGGDVIAALNTAVTEPPTEKSLHDILHKDGSYNYDNTTDSLEAIADGVGAISSPTDVTDAVPNTPTAKSLQDILSKLDGANTYDNTTDSLEAISDKVTAITDNVGEAVPDTPTANSLQDILSKLDGGNTFDNTTDSLEAISDKITDVSTDIAAAVPDTPVGGSLQDILSKLDGANTYDNTTDSLEAIADALAAGTGATVAIEADLLNYLVKEADGGGNAYPDSVTSDSVMAYLMAKGNPAAITSYDNTTDSLEAISDFVRTGTTLGAGIQLDHLQATTTGVAADDDLSTYAVTGSLMAHLMSATAITSTYDCSTDSLEAIAAALLAGTGATAALDADQLDHLVGTTTGVAAGSDLESYCVSGSLMAHVLSVAADVTTFDCRTDSLEVISDKLGAYTFDGGADDEDTIMAHLDLINTAVDTILVDTAVVEPIVKMGRQTVKAAGVDLKTGDKNVFTVATGPVKITSLFFILTEATDAACKAGFTCTPSAGAETDLTPVDGSGVELNAASDAGDIVYSELDDTIMVIANTDGGDVPKVPEYSQIVPIGIISLALENSAPGTGIADVYIQWEALAPGATLTAT